MKPKKPVSAKVPLDIRHEWLAIIKSVAELEGMAVSTFIKHLVATHPKMKGHLKGMLP